MLREGLEGALVGGGVLGKEPDEGDHCEPSVLDLLELTVVIVQLEEIEPYAGRFVAGSSDKHKQALAMIS